MGTRAEYTQGMDSLRDLAGRDLGSQRVVLSESEMTYYALTIVGDLATGFDVLFDGGQPTCPSYAFVLGGWALVRMTEVAEVDNTRTVMVGAKLELLRPLQVDGSVEMDARVAHVWDTGTSALVEVEVNSDAFRITYVIYVPDGGGFGGEHPPRAHSYSDRNHEYSVPLPMSDSVLYRKLNSLDEVNEVQARPVQPGLMMMARAFVSMMLQMGVTVEEVRSLQGRFTSSARSGEPLMLEGSSDGSFVVRGDHGVVIDEGRLTVMTRSDS
jgi:hypothetical protein